MAIDTGKIFRNGRHELVWMAAIVAAVISVFVFFGDHFASTERVNGLEQRYNRQEREIGRRLQVIDGKLDRIQRDMMKAADK